MKIRIPNGWEAVGKFFGYPDCCVKAFVTLEHLGDPDRENRPLMGTGFVACAECAATKTAEQLRQEIAAARICPLPFPLTDEQYGLLEFES